MYLSDGGHEVLGKDAEDALIHRHVPPSDDLETVGLDTLLDCPEGSGLEILLPDKEEKKKKKRMRNEGVLGRHESK